MHKIKTSIKYLIDYLTKMWLIEFSFWLISVSDDGKNIPIPYRNESEVYSALIEQNQQVSNAVGIEITELYDGKQNLGVAIKRTLNTNILTYTFVNEDEFLLISPDGTCRVLKQEDALTLSNFQVIRDKNGVKHIASPLTLLSANVDIPRAYLGSRNRFVRGIAVREWQACVYSETNEATLRLTYSYSSIFLASSLKFIYLFLIEIE